MGERLRPDSRLRRIWHDPAARIAVIYAAVAALWIVASDAVLHLALQGDPAQLSAAQTTKGLLFIAFSTLLIFVLVRRAGNQRQRAEAALDRSEAPST